VFTGVSEGVEAHVLDSFYVKSLLEKPQVFPRELDRVCYSGFIIVQVHIQVDFIRPKEGEFEERECATVRYGGASA
jgi:hypothetical protein